MTVSALWRGHIGPWQIEVFPYNTNVIFLIKSSLYYLLKLYINFFSFNPFLKNSLRIFWMINYYKIKLTSSSLDDE